MVRSQRRRLYRATVEIVARRGYRKATVRGLSRLAGISTGTFYRHFANVDECFASTYQAMMLLGMRRAAARRDQSEDWEAGFRAALLELMEGLASDPDAARVLLVEIFEAGPVAQERMRAMTGEFEQLLTMSLNAAPERFVAPRHLVVGIAAGTLRVARTTTLTGRVDELPRLAGSLADWILALPGADLLGLRSDPVRHQLRTDAESDGDRPTNDRDRVLSVAAKLGFALGYGELTATRIRKEAGVSRRSFDALFPDGVDECFLASIEELGIRAAAKAEDLAASEESWEKRLHLTTGSLCGQIASDPMLAQLVLVDILKPGSKGLLRRERLITSASARLRDLAPPRLRPTELATEASIAAAWRIAHADVVAGRAKKLPLIAPLLTYLLVAPVLGSGLAIETLRGA